MATYNADIRIGVVGKSSLNQLEAQLKRVNKQVTALQKSVKLRGLNQRLSLDTRAAMSAVDALQRKISRLSQTVRVNLQTSEERRAQSQGSSLGIATGGPGGQAAATVARIAQKNTQELQKQLSTTKSLATAADDYQEAVGKAVQQNNKIKERLQEQEKLQQRLEKLRTQTDRRMAANLFGAGTTNEEAIKRTKKELYGVRTSLRNLQERQEGYNKAVRDGIALRNEELAKLAEINGKLRRAAQLEADGQERRVNGQTFDERLAAVQRRRNRFRGAGRGAAVGAGAAALQIPGVSGVASGGLAGFAAGGPAGAAAGAAAAAVTELAVALGSYGAEAAKAATETDLLRRALVGVVGGAEYQSALEGISEITRDFNQEIASTTQSFTKLAAATRANGLNAEETTEVYKGLAAANLALGGDAQKLEGILLATSQVFSKGKVQAEELRGQIGERLPGAFALFARSLGISTAQLDKALEQGEVSVEDFVNFTKFLFKEYEKDAEKIAKSPEAAAARLTSSLSLLQDSVGRLLKPVRQSFLETANFIVEQLTRVSNFLNRMVIKQQEDNIRLLKLARAGAINNNNFELAQEIQEKIDAARDVLNELKYGPTGAGQPLGQNGGNADTGETPEQRKKREADERAAKRLAEQQARQAKINDLLKSDQVLRQQLLSIEDRRNELTEGEAARLELLAVYDADIRRIKRSVTDEEEKQLKIKNRQLDLAKELRALENSELAKRQKATESLKSLVDEIAGQGLVTSFEKVNEQVAQISPGMQAANQAGQELYRTFENLIFATENWTDVLLDALKALSSILIKFALGGLAGGDGQGLFSFLNGTLSPTSNTPAPNYALSNPQNFASAAFPGRASGGGVSGGKPYVVGEQGSELFIPGKSGTIVPSDVFNATRAAMSNSATEGGDSDAFDQNSVAMGTSASITKEKAITREMALAGSTDVNVRYDSTVINNVSYVSEEQFQQGIKAAVAQSKASVFRDLKNKPRARAGIGI